MAHDERRGILSGPEEGSATGAASADPPGARHGAAASPLRHAFYHAVRLASKPVFAAYFRLRRIGPDATAGEGALILAANHVSYLDPAVVGSSAVRPIRFLIHEPVHRHWSMNWFYRGMRSIPVARDGSIARAALREALRALQSGEVVGIFPEGARVSPGAADSALVGVALLARRSGAPVVPVGIRGAGRAMPRGVALPRPVAVSVRHGAPLLYDQVTQGLAGRAADEAFTRELMTRIRELAGSGTP